MKTTTKQNKTVGMTKDKFLNLSHEARKSNQRGTTNEMSMCVMTRNSKCYVQDKVLGMVRVFSPNMDNLI